MCTAKGSSVIQPRPSETMQREKKQGSLCFLNFYFFSLYSLCVKCKCRNHNHNEILHLQSKFLMMSRMRCFAPDDVDICRGDKGEEAAVVRSCTWRCESVLCVGAALFEGAASSCRAPDHTSSSVRRVRTT